MITLEYHTNYLYNNNKKYIICYVILLIFIFCLIGSFVYIHEKKN